MKRDQWALFAHCRGDWAICWLLADFDPARQHIVSGQGGGTYYLDDGTTAWYETTAKGMFVLSRLSEGNIITSLRWPEIRDWCQSQTQATIARAVELRAELREVQDLYPPLYPSIGHHGYAWDRKGATEEEIAADRVLLAEATAVIHEKRELHAMKMREHNAVVREFIRSLAPSDEPTDLLELLAAGGDA